MGDILNWNRNEIVKSYTVYSGNKNLLRLLFKNYYISSYKILTFKKAGNWQLFMFVNIIKQNPEAKNPPLTLY